MNPLPLELLRCVQAGSSRRICRGKLAIRDWGFVCLQCGHEYAQVQDVPILKPSLKDRENWYGQANAHYQENYSGRSRSVDIKTEYLIAERSLMAQLVREQRIEGYCLEIGCGTGIFAEAVPRFLGLDYSLELLLAEGFSRWPRICGDARLLPLGDASMSCIFTFNSLEHVPEVDLAFEEMDRVLATNGLLVLKPAWHCARYVTELIHLRKYRELNWRKKSVKMLLPLIKSRPFKLLRRLPSRLWRSLTSGRPSQLRWTMLNPNPNELWRGGDVDAVTSLDSHEAILYYRSRGYHCLSHATILRRLLAGHDMVILRKTATRCSSEAIRRSRKRRLSASGILFGRCSKQDHANIT
jgi:SAM-dependent methyltransferase